MGFFRSWAVISSPSIFTHDNTIDNFVVVSINVVTKVELVITVGIIVIHNFISNKDNIVTVPSTFTFWDIEWTHTVDISVVWAEFISPDVFNIDDTLVDFTRINSSIIVGITSFEHDL